MATAVSSSVFSNAVLSESKKANTLAHHDLDTASPTRTEIVFDHDGGAGIKLRVGDRQSTQGRRICGFVGLYSSITNMYI